MKLLIDIVLTFIKIQLLSFGGGHASIPVVQTEIVEIKHWMSIEEFSNLLAMDELTPGPLAINCATFVGKHLAGIPGAIAATVGCIIPSCVIALIFAKMYKKYFQNKIFANSIRGLRCMVIALLVYTTIYLFSGTILPNGFVQYKSLIIFIIALLILEFIKPNPLLVIIGSGILGLIFNVI